MEEKEINIKGFKPVEKNVLEEAFKYMQTILFNTSDCIGSVVMQDGTVRNLSLIENIRMSLLCCRKRHWCSLISCSIKALAAFLKGSQASSLKPYDTDGQFNNISASDTSVEALSRVWSRFNRTV